jgi:hypothetical protein
MALEGCQPRLFWLYARQVDRARFGTDRVPLYPNDVYTKYVRRELVQAGLVAEAAQLATGSPGEFAEHFRHLGGHVLGIALCKPASMTSLMLYMGRQQRHIQDYWQQTPFSDCPVLFLEVLHVVKLLHPETARTSAAAVAPKGVFFTPTAYTVDRCRRAGLSDSDLSVDGFIAEVGQRFNMGLEPPTAAMAVPIPHCMLATCNAWKFLGVPLAHGRRGAGLGLTVIKPWVRIAGPIHQCQAANPGEELSIEMMQGIADIMRAQQLGVANAEEVRHYIGFAQRVRDDMFRQQLGLSKKLYAMTHLVHSMLLSGMLSGRGSMHSAVTRALHVAIKEKTVLAHYLKLIDSTEVIPSQTTLYRHRLTMHMAFCRHAQDKLQTRSGQVVLLNCACSCNDLC